jgi:hypothetical protein
VVEIVNVVVTAPLPGVTVVGAKVQLASDGNPVQAKLTCWVKPPAGVTVRVVVPLPPAAAMAMLVGLAPTVNDRGTAAFTVMVTAEEVEDVKLVSPPYFAVTL